MTWLPKGGGGDTFRLQPRALTVANSVLAINNKYALIV